MSDEDERDKALAKLTVDTAMEIVERVLGVIHEQRRANKPLLLAAVAGALHGAFDAMLYERSPEDSEVVRAAAAAVRTRMLRMLVEGGALDGTDG